MKKVVFAVLLIFIICTPATWAAESTGLGQYLAAQNVTGIIIAGDIFRNFADQEVEAGLGFLYGGKEAVWFPLYGCRQSFGMDTYILKMQSGVLYHHYPQGNNAGFFTGGGIRVGFETRTGMFMESEGTYLNLTPEMLVGYRFNYKFLTAAARVELGFNLSEEPALMGPFKGLFLEIGLLLKPDLW